MKVLLDECVPRVLAAELIGHEVATTRQMRWLNINNGRLLQRAADAGFDVFLTADQNLPHQQNLLKLPVAVVVMRAASNRIEALLPLVPEILATLAVLQRRTLQYVPRP